MMMDGQYLNEHAIKRIGKLRPINSDIFGGGEHFDQVLKNPGKRLASRDIISSPSKDNSDRLKSVTKRPFWHIAPDGETIERTYEGPEPLNLKDLED